MDRFGLNDYYTIIGISKWVVAAYLLVVPLQYPEDSARKDQVAVALPLLEAVEHAALRARVPVDARIEKGRSLTHALRRLWDVERFDRIVAPATGFTPKELAWILTQAPFETVVLVEPRPRKPRKGLASGIVPRIKRYLVGRPMASDEMDETLLPKWLALPIFASDPLSSVAYATEAALVVLVSASVASVHLAFPIAIAIATLLAIVVLSYRQTVQVYESSGGAYIVAKENLGRIPSLVAAAALLTDYVLTVAVSVAAGSGADLRGLVAAVS